MKYEKTLFTLLFLFSATTILFASEGIDGLRIDLKADDWVVVQHGEKIYHTHCAACHGADLEGQPDWRIRNAQGYLPAPPHDATGHTWHHADDLLFEIVKYGAGEILDDPEFKTIMPVFKDVLGDDDIIAVLSFIKNTWPEEQRSWQDDVNGTNSDGQIPNTRKRTSIIDKILGE